MVLGSAIDFAVRRSWLLMPAAAAGAGVGFALEGIGPAMAAVAAVALAPATVVSAVLELLGGKMRTPSQLKRRHHLETLAVVRRFKATPGTAVPTEKYAAASEAYSELADSLRQQDSGDLRTLLVTSAVAEEGKSTTAVNLAMALARTGSRVILVDADLRWSSLRPPAAPVASVGLSGLLLGLPCNPEPALVESGDANLRLLPSGPLPVEPRELLALPRLGEVLAGLQRLADYVVVDSPPLLEAEDAVLLADNVDATLLVVRAGRTRNRDVKKALRRLADTGIRPLGAVLNRTRKSRRVAIKAPAPLPAVPSPAVARIVAAEVVVTPVAQASNGAPAVGETSVLAPAPAPGAGRRRGLVLIEGLEAAGDAAAEPMGRASWGSRLGSPEVEAALEELLASMEQTLLLIRSMRGEGQASATDWNDGDVRAEADGNVQDEPVEAVAGT